jgi:aminopeptidase
MRKHVGRIGERIVKSMRIKEGDMVLVSAGEHNLRLAEAIALECYKIGAPPIITASSDGFTRAVYEQVDEKHLEKTHKHLLSAFDSVDVRITIEPYDDPFLLKDVPLSKLGARRRAHKPIWDKQIKGKIRWLYIGYPTQRMADAFCVDYDNLKEMYLQMLDIDYAKLSKRAHALRDRLKHKKQIQLITDGNELTFSIKDRRINIDDGYLDEENIRVGDVGLNLPSGEVFIAPVEDSANGTVAFNCPTFRDGKKIKNLKLTFRNGRVIDISATEGGDVFRKILGESLGDADRLGEFGIGLNPFAVPIGYTLTDEKVAGSIHLALGENRGYGGKNNSSLHWDIVALKPTFRADNELIMKDGKLRL